MGNLLDELPTVVHGPCDTSQGLRDHHLIFDGVCSGCGMDAVDVVPAPADDLRFERAREDRAWDEDWS